MSRHTAPPDAHLEQAEEGYREGEDNRHSRQQCCIRLCQKGSANPDQHVHGRTVR